MLAWRTASAVYLRPGQLCSTARRAVRYSPPRNPRLVRTAASDFRNPACSLYPFAASVTSVLQNVPAGFALDGT
jgi:hypothetical protein